MTMNGFADMKNDLPFSEGKPLPTEQQAKEAVVKTFMQPCPKCSGRGIFYSYRGDPVGKCFACKGVGKQEFKTSPEQRERARQAAQARKESQQQGAWEGFAAQHPEVAAWILASQASFEFAASLGEAVRKFGSLTERQLAAAQRCVDGRKAAQEARSAAITAAPALTLEMVEKAFQTASEAGVRRPKLRLDVFTFSMAPATGKNAGAIYVKEGEQYLGKVQGGRFLRTRDCTDAQQAGIQAVAADPLAAAVAYGRRYGSCSVCGRELTNGESIDRGIGPICAGKFGW
jgi:hypothetical protein